MTSTVQQATPCSKLETHNSKLITMSEQELVRRDNLQKIKDLGINPYPPELFPVNVSAAEIKASYEEEVLEDGTKPP